MNEDQVRDAVSSAYTEALRRSKDGQGGCCGPADPARAKRDDEASAIRGYDREKDQYAEAAASSFGCGNPLAFAGVQPGQTVLDLGSGAGFDLLIASDKVGADGKVIGVDMTDAMIAQARETAARAGKSNIEVRKGIIEDLPVDSGTVDWVISNCVINLSPNKPQVFREIHRVLKPGGQFSISDVVVEGLPDWIRKNAAAYSACLAGAISEVDYLGGMRAAGLVDIEVKERLVYDADQLRTIIGDDIGSFGISEELLAKALPLVVGKVWSAKIAGRRPE